MIVYPRKILVGRIATVALLSSKRHAGHGPLSATHGGSSLDHMLAPEELQKSPHVWWEHIRTPVESTQDEARRLLRERPSAATNGAGASSGTLPRYLAVLADIQRRGRGTRRRRWEGGDNASNDGTRNLYLTVCVPFDDVPVTVTLLPLQIAVLVAERAARLLGRCGAPDAVPRDDTAPPPPPPPRVTVKWPNDVLVDGRKLSGTLIESEVVAGTTWLLVGIGVNVAVAPDLSRSPGRAARPATCLRDLCCRSGAAPLPEDTAAYFASDLVAALVAWIRDGDDKLLKERRVIEAWKSLAEFGKQFELRGEAEDEDRGLHKGEVVTVVDIRNDGQLVVRGEDGRERTLIADYLF